MLSRFWGQPGLFHVIGDVVARVAIGRVEIVGVLPCRERHGAYAAVPEIPVPVEVFETRVLEFYGFEDSPLEIAIIGMRVGALEVPKHGSFVGVRAVVLIFCRQLLGCQGAIDCNLFRRRPALQRVKPRLAAPQQERRIHQRLFCRFRDDLVHLGRSFFRRHRLSSAAAAGRFEGSRGIGLNARGAPSSRLPLAGHMD
jgi:hypothetical protein